MTTWNLHKICTCGLSKQPCQRHIYDRDEFNKSLRTTGNTEAMNRDNWERETDKELYYCHACQEEYELPFYVTKCPICLGEDLESI